MFPLLVCCLFVSPSCGWELLSSQCSRLRSSCCEYSWSCLKICCHLCSSMLLVVDLLLPVLGGRSSSLQGSFILPFVSGRSGVKDPVVSFSYVTCVIFMNPCSISAGVCVGDSSSGAGVVVGCPLGIVDGGMSQAVVVG